MHKRTVSVFIAAAVVVLSAAACSSSGNSNSSSSGGSSSASAAATGSTVSVVVPCQVTGPVPYPECASSVQAYFDQVNASGGVDGHKLTAIICDTQDSAVTEVDCLKSGVANPSVVAFVGHTGFSPSTDKGMADIGILANTPALTTAPMDFTVGSFSGTTGGDSGAKLIQQLLLAKGIDKPGMIACTLEGCIDDEKGAQAFYAPHGISVKIVTASLTAVDLTPQMTALQHAGVNLVDIAEGTGGVVGAIKAAVGLSYTPSFNLSYSADSAEVLTQLPDAPNVWVPTMFNPAASARAPYTQLMNTYIGTGKWSLSYAGLNAYLGAQAFVDDLKGISGPITRASVLAGMKKITNFSSPLLGAPIDFATAPVAAYPAIYNWYWFAAQVKNKALVPVGGAVDMASGA
jgi:branched-chain amino acid transport system substrate-binding protein